MRLLPHARARGHERHRRAEPRRSVPQRAFAEGLERSTIRGVVEEQIKIPNPEGAMPKDLVTGSTAKDVAAYVAQVGRQLRARTRGLLATAVQAPGAGKPAVEKDGKLQIPASPTGQLAYATNKATATAGPVTIEMPNMSGVDHNLAVETGAHGASGPRARCSARRRSSPRASTSVKVTLKAGRLHVLLRGPRAPPGGHVRHAHGQVAPGDSPPPGCARALADRTPKTRTRSSGLCAKNRNHTMKAITASTTTSVAISSIVADQLPACAAASLRSTASSLRPRTVRGSRRSRAGSGSARRSPAITAST